MTDGFGDDAEGDGNVIDTFQPVRADNHDNGEGSTAAIDFRSQTGSA